jgi:hypothetical protein
MRVLRQGSRTAIEISRGTKYAYLIPMSQSGLTVVNEGLERTDREWIHVEDYPVHRAASKYLEYTTYLGATQAAVNALKGILMHYIIEKSGKILSAGNKKDTSVEFSKLDEKTRLDTARLVSDAEGLKELSLTALTELYNGLVEPEDTIKKFGDKEKAVARTWAALEFQHDPKVRAKAEKAEKDAAKAAEKAEKDAAKAPAEPKAKREPRGEGEARGEPRPDSKMGKLLAVLREGGNYILESLSEASGYDAQNTRTAIGILRSKNKIDIAYDRESKTYSLA